MGRKAKQAPQHSPHLPVLSAFPLSYTIKWLYLWPKPSYFPILFHVLFRLGCGVVQSPIRFLLSTLLLRFFLIREPTEDMEAVLINQSIRMLNIFHI